MEAPLSGTRGFDIPPRTMLTRADEVIE